MSRTLTRRPAAWVLLGLFILSSHDCVAGESQIAGRKLLDEVLGLSKEDHEFQRSMAGAKLYLKNKGVWKEETDLIVPGTTGRGSQEVRATPFCSCCCCD